MSKTSNPFDELAAMFLTADSPKRGDAERGSAPSREHVAPAGPLTLDDAAAVSPRSGVAATELLIVGHLPVRGNLWLTPYADALAREVGATALVRLDAPEPSLQLLRAPIALASASLQGSMLDVIERIGSSIETWIIRAPAGMSVKSLAGFAQSVDHITLLTSADEAAVIAAYQIIKDLADGAQSAAINSLPPIGVAVVGADPATAAAVVERLNRTTCNFLDVKLQLTMCLSRMDAGIKTTRYMGFAEETQPSMIELLECINRAKTIADPAPVSHEVAGRLYAERSQVEFVPPTAKPKSPPAKVSEPDFAAALRPQRIDPARPIPHVAPKVAPWPAAAAEHSATGMQRKPRTAPTTPVTPLNGHDRLPPIKLAPKPARMMEPKHAGQPHEPDAHGRPVSLASYIKGLELLPVRSPGHEHIEIAVDAEGRLHLLGNEQTLREMPLVANWTTSHRELLIMACPQHPIDSLAPAQCHIFSDKPASLADLHGTNLHLHVLAPVTVNGQTGWYSAPLNIVATA